MTNLEYLDKFLTETYGAICFYNDKEDGFVKFEKNISSKMSDDMYKSYKFKLDYLLKEMYKWIKIIIQEKI